MSTEHIQSPMPGVFYRRPDPDEDLFVEEGDQVSAGDTVGLVGVMKTFHDITAESDGTIVEILAEEEQEIQAGEPLFTIELE